MQSRYRAGEVVGYYLDVNDFRHAFLRTAHGTVTAFNVPGAMETLALGINPAGVTTGTYIDQNHVGSRLCAQR